MHTGLQVPIGKTQLPPLNTQTAVQVMKIFQFTETNGQYPQQ